MKPKIQQLRNSLEREKGRRSQIKSSIISTQRKAKEAGRDMRRWEQAREIIREVGLKTQQQLQYHIGDITSLALEAVFPVDPYELVVEFVERRNKTECDLYFSRDGHKIHPLSASGVGAVDVATFALRIAAWSMQIPKRRNVIILDEPFRFLSAEYQEKASRMVKELSEKLGLQFIIITHEQILSEYADKTFHIQLKKGKSIIK